MPYPNAGTLANIFALVRKEFEDVAEYRAADINNNWLIYKANDALDEIYQICYTEPDQVTFTGTVGTWQYPFDGSTNPPNINKGAIDEIVRVDYDNSPITRLLVVGDIILPSSSTSNADPTSYFEMWDNGVRNLCFNTPLATADTVRIWFTKPPTILTATTSVPTIDKDFWKLVEKMLIVRVNEKLRLFDQAQYWQRKVDKDMALLMKKVNRRLGKQAKRIGILGAQDLISNS